MTTREVFRQVMKERRQWPNGSGDWAYRTRAARRLAWIIRGIPTTEWGSREREFPE